MGEPAGIALICAGCLGTNLGLSLSQALFSGKPVKMASGVTLKGKEKGDPEILFKLTSDYVTWLCLKPFHSWLPRTMSKMPHVPLWSS